MDLDDLKLLNDIALIDQQLEIRPSDSTSDLQKTLDSGAETSAGDDGKSTERVDDNTPKELNLACQKALRDIEKKLVETLEENLEKQKNLLKYLKESNKKHESSDDSNVCSLISCAGIPYFKDFYGYPQPRNEDVKEKLAYGELLCSDYLTNSCAWSKHDKDCLTKAVLNECKHKGDGADKPQVALEGTSKKQAQVEKPIDWMKISATDMNGKYTPTECESQWKLHLSPDVNKQKWTPNEIKNLNLIAEKFKYQDWDKIASELGTNRSGYQCCIQYQMKNSLNNGKWTKEEDNYLKELIEKFKRNNEIQWRKISWFFQTRSRKQCQDRYLEHLRTDLKKGHFNDAEDRIIVCGAKIFKDFGKLAKFLPGRAPTQIRSRYYYLIGSSMTEFTLEEDELLLSLVKKHSTDWLAISEHFPNRSKLQCRKRYATLCREKNGDTLPELWSKIQDCKKVTSKPESTKLKKPKKEKGRIEGKPRKEECEVYNEIVKYHENCSENYFGPRLRNPATEEELKTAALNLRATMAMLSVSCDFSEKTDIIESLKNNCNFDLYDLKLLRKLAEEDSSSETTLKDNYLLHGMLIPPNRATLTGYQTISSSRMRIQMRTCEAEGLPQPSAVRPENEASFDRLSFARAKTLFKSRMKSLFLLPLILSKIPTNNLSQEVFYQGKKKKPKKMTKKRLRNHAKKMSDAYQAKRRKLAEEAVTSQETIGETEGGEGGEKSNSEASTPMEEVLPNADITEVVNSKESEISTDVEVPSGLRRSTRKRKMNL